MKQASWRRDTDKVTLTAADNRVLMCLGSTFTSIELSVLPYSISDMCLLVRNEPSLMLRQ